MEKGEDSPTGMNITLIIPYYRSPLMIQKHLEVIDAYPPGYRVIIVDDCSPEPAEECIGRGHENLELYRIDTDIPWNREGARNLGAHLADTEWIIHVDTDHILPVDCAISLLEEDLDPSAWYRFSRFRVGKADDTRKKDAIPDDLEYGPVKPHIDSYLCTRDMYWEAGGYNEDYSGCLGGGGPFLKRMKKTCGEPIVFYDIFLEVYTRDKFPDASVSDLSRDKTEFKNRQRKIGRRKGKNPLRFDWRKIEL